MINIEWPNETFMPRLVIFCVLCFLLPSAHSQNKISFVYTSTENKPWTLRVRYLSTKTIEYYFSKSLRSELPKQCSKHQRAKNIIAGDPGIDSDTEGLAYPVDEYIFDDGICYVGIRINSIDRSRVTVVMEHASTSERGKRAPIAKAFVSGAKK